MGWSCSVKANNCLRVLGISTESEHLKCSNMFKSNKGTFFYEISRKEYPDGDIKGTVFKLIEENTYIKYGSFHIDGNGRIVKFAGSPVKWRHYRDYIQDIKRAVFNGSSFVSMPKLGEETKETLIYNKLLPIIMLENQLRIL